MRRRLERCEMLCSGGIENIENAFLSQKIHNICTGEELSDVAADVVVEEQSQSSSEISNAFTEVEMYAFDVKHTIAMDAVRRAKRALLDFIYLQNKKKTRQTLVVQYFKE